ncbi:MAG: NAD(P)-dependent oxidoreductase [Acidimicrobiales bacterium]
MVNAEFLAKMKPGAILLNTSRGEVIDEAALLDALSNRGLRAGLDVYANEPGSGSGEWTSALAQHPSVVGTHHIGASTNQAQEAVADGTVETILAYLAGSVTNCVNLSVKPTGPVTLSIRHRDKVGVLAKIFQTIRSNGINVQQMSNQVFSGGGAAVATMTIASQPSPSLIDELNQIEEIIAISQTPAGS